MANFKGLKHFVDSPSVLMAIVAGFFLCYMLKSYSNKQSMLLSGFQQPIQHRPAATEAFVPSDSGSGMGSGESVLSGNSLGDTGSLVGGPSMHDDVNALLPNGESPQVNLLNPDQIIGMKGQVKRNQTFDLRGNIPIPKQMVPFNNPVAVADDIYSRGINTLT
tara:strand:- start:141 stop:629 length:489 start_codon:yes stop_codon:yes gene_type:complete